jgi:sugar phosphate isomerase/epimerase
MMQLGFVSAVVADLSLEETLKLAAELQYDCVELLCWPKGKAERRYAGVTHVDVVDFDDAAARDVQKLIDRIGVHASALGYYPNYLEGSDEEIRVYVDHFKQVISAAKKLGLTGANTFIGRDHTRDVDYNFDRFREIWPEIVTHAEKEGIRIGIENCPMAFTGDEWPGGKNLAGSPAHWRRMFEIIPSDNFGLNYDPSHMIWQMMDYIRPIYEFKDKIFHVHIKDAKVMVDQLNDVGIMATPLEFHSPKLPGLGDVDWGRFFSALTDIGYRGPVVVEVEDRAFEDSLQSRKDSLVVSRNHVKQFLPLR